ncbi:hypothetical protein HaLaN_15808 [Haematococcus lacustris]|uniref:Uncharacterized protein n=1 Tax=Haematococcus lacustris TaxID=44745 RepID=A0A699ZBZ4_HAELA|nr:hypothetical protein HaLaN_15808 [Haematococcus lacustris]
MRLPCVARRIPGGKLGSRLILARDLRTISACAAVIPPTVGALPVPAKEELPAQESVAADHLHDHCHAGARMPGPRGPFDIRQQHLETLRQNLLAFIKRGSLPLDPSTWILAKH